MQVYTNTQQFTRRSASMYTMSMVDAPLEKFVEEVEKDLLTHIYTHLKENEITAESAQKLAQDFLALLPFQDKKDLLDKLNELGKAYPEARETYAKYIGPFEEQDRQQKLDLMRKHIKEGNLEAAIQVAKGGQNASSSNTGKSASSSSTSS